MDAIDNKILVELDINPKIRISRLAKKLRISQQVADYRVKRLFSQNYISKLAAVINLKALGQEHYRIFFTFNAKKEYSSKAIFDYLKSQKGVYWSARTGGKYDLLVVLFVTDFENFDKFIDNFNQNFPGLIKNYVSCYVTDYYIYRHKYLSKNYDAIEYGYNDKVLDITDLDRKILDAIKDNCRISSLELSKELGTSYKTIINRIKIMERKNIILGYRMFIKSEDQKPFVILLSFRNYSREAEKKLIAYLARANSVTQTLRLFGTWNLFIHARIEDNERLQNLIIELRDKFDIIDNCEIIPIFEDISIDLMPL